MTKRNQKTEHTANMTPLGGQWRVFERYTIEDDRHSSERKVIEGKGNQATSYRLDLPNIHVQLLNDYLKVKNEETALRWISHYGLPVNGAQNFVYFDEVISSAATIIWLESFRGSLYQALTGDVTELRDCLVKVEIPVGSSIAFQHRVNTRLGVTEMSEEDRAKYDIDILCANRVLSVDEQAYNFTSSWLPQTFSSKHYLVTFGPSQLNCPGFTRMLGSNNSGFGFSHPNPMFLYESKIWEENEKSFLIFAALSYVQEAFRNLLIGVQPGFEWYFQSYWRLLPGFLVSCPWQAVSLALYHKFNHSSQLRRCDAPGCSEIIIGRRNKRFHSDACRMQVQRNKLT